MGLQSRDPWLARRSLSFFAKGRCSTINWHHLYQQIRVSRSMLQAI
ncbi:hypothetical protein UCMB321_4353 [Pseudomonas batumici]|uniref:Uncharacterized protein n=1 Tax=Pseudomonas batumici TaxID=226910 RepID=A0A0C2I416_9PSED|nr:hypothetical protein UCMB321_4353 [Pseudomonas batumici]